jgi:TM2 domain-containing membrane protein YozV
MSRKPLIASLLSLLIPGLGQICSGKDERGAAILIAAIVVGNLNVIWLSLFATTSAGTHTFWGHALPRILHDLFAAWGLVFLAWQVVDAYRQAKPALHSLAGKETSGAGSART